MEVELPRTTGGVLKRAITIVTVFLAAIAAMVALVTAGPDGAAERVPTARSADPLATAAAQSLADMRAARIAHVAAALSGGSGVDAVADATYAADLGVVAGLVAPHTSVGPEAFVQAWTVTDPTRMTVLLSALAEVGVPYRSMGSSPESGFDCSGFTMYAWSQVAVALPHQDRSQMAVSTARTWETAKPADLVQYPGHVMLYLGAGQAIVHAPNTGTVVRVQDITRSVRLASPLG